MEIKREWAMPNSRTFAIKPIRELIDKYISDKKLVIDPFANNNRIANITNDIDPDCDADYHLDAIDFLKVFEDQSVDCVLYDPPYSPRQVSEMLHKTWQNSKYANHTSKLLEQSKGTDWKNCKAWWCRNHLRME